MIIRNNRKEMCICQVAPYVIIFSFVTFYACQTAWAAGSSGVEVGLDSARALGKGGAVVADPKDAATLVYNPAGLTKLEGKQMAMNSTIIVPITEYINTRGASENGSVLPIYIPSYFMSFDTPIESLKIGTGINSPFGLASQWSSTGNFKYTGIANEVKSIYYTVDVAYQVKPRVSLAAGVSYIESSLRQIGKLNSTFLVGSGGDINTEIDTKGHGMGWNMGALFTPDDKWSLGAFYRSAVRTAMDGEYNADNIQAVAAQAVFGSVGNTSFRTSVNTDITFPDTLVLGANYKATEKLDIEADLGWTGWGKWDHFDFVYGTPNAFLNGGDPAEHKFQDTISINVGANYKLNPRWQVSGGYAFYQQAALENDYSNAFLDGDRHNFAVGLQYTVGSFSISTAYAAQFVRQVHIDNNVGAANNANMDGTYSALYHVFLTSITYKFG